MTKQLQILGGGPAGLSIAWYAKQKGIPLTLFEANHHAGGNCRTFSELINSEYFRYDTGAHRFHDKDPKATALVKSLLGDDLLTVEAPSQIFYNGKHIGFPLSPFDLLKKLGPGAIFKATSEIISQRTRTGKLRDPENFKEKAYRDYGKTLADAFLINYSEKLWGLPGEQLAAIASGGRLQGLNLQTFLIERFKGRKATSRHLDGQFYYPRLGYGMITSALAQTLSSEELQTSTPVTGLDHRDNKITDLHLTGGRKINASAVASSLPLDLTVRLLNPKPPEAILNTASSIRFRDLFLVILIINKARISHNATQYFPESRFPFTRISEPKNRSMAMAPEDKTSLIIEIPVSAGSTLPGRHFIENEIIHALVKLRLFKANEVIATRSHHLKNAYPVLELDFEEKVAQLTNYLGKFTNLHLAGRNGLFAYNHLHDQLKTGHDLVTRIF